MFKSYMTTVKTINIRKALKSADNHMTYLDQCKSTLKMMGQEYLTSCITEWGVAYVGFDTEGSSNSCWGIRISRDQESTLGQGLLDPTANTLFGETRRLTSKR
ncbi:hypothetical protein AVEN_181787-1 [Araneus ventricosus]|uniref:Uncharacterized protein n=1 Tax=Araneus ventricosus TaxID=182803 RepID=A0A4Y2RV48_ARAVE|nr:hypothetical protein AVEN_38214-1 [Araneus ventricosus]GBN79667.1 hypothetical protein AVEN_181787-1 [Araneus ventricosus]